MKVSVTGYKGHVGAYLVREYPDIFYPLNCDVNDSVSIESCIHKERPDIVLHLAGKSGVDFCEDERNQELVIHTNVRGTFNVADVCETLGCQMVMLSSAYVFSGNRLWGKYKEKDTPNPANFYGQSKLAAEGITYKAFQFNVIRTSYLFDDKRLANIIVNYCNDETQSFPTFIKRSFTYLPHFASCLVQYVQRYSSMPPILHLAGNENVSWYKFMSDFFYYAGYDMNKILPRNQEEDGHAPRGKNLGLDVSLSERLGLPQHSYLDGIKEMIGE